MAVVRDFPQRKITEIIYISSSPISIQSRESICTVAPHWTCVLSNCIEWHNKIEIESCDRVVAYGRSDCIIKVDKSNFFERNFAKIPRCCKISTKKISLFGYKTAWAQDRLFWSKLTTYKIHRNLQASIQSYWNMYILGTINILRKGLEAGGDTQKAYANLTKGGGGPSQSYVKF